MMLEETTVLIIQADIITDQNPQTQENWLIQIGQNLQGLEKIEDGIIMLQAKVLYEVWSIWEASHNDEGRFLNQEATQKWQYSFHNWAKAYTKKRALREPHQTTIDNKIRVYKKWSTLIEPPQTVLIPKRDEWGYEIGEEEVDFNFEDCDFGKLLISTVPASKGEMSPEAWSALRDPYTTVETLEEKLGKRQPKSPDTFYLIEQDGIIYGCQDGARKAVLQVIFENDEGDELFHRTLNHVLKALGLPTKV